MVHSLALFGREEDRDWTQVSFCTPVFTVLFFTTVLYLNCSGLFPCIVHQTFPPRSSIATDIAERFKSFYTKLLGSSVYKAVVLLICFTCLGFGIYGWIEIREVGTWQSALTP